MKMNSKNVQVPDNWYYDVYGIHTNVLGVVC